MVALQHLCKCYTPLPVPLVAKGANSSPSGLGKRRGGDDNVHRTRQTLQSKSLSPRKWLGQHYMVNQTINEKLVQFAEVEKGDMVLEIGPGTGSLTNILVQAGANVVAVEKDPNMAALVMERFQGNEQVKVVHEDFLKWPVQFQMSQLMQSSSWRTEYSRKAKVVSNLPFNITTDVVKCILPMGEMFSHMSLLLQDETAMRLVDAMPGTSNYRPISLFVKYFSEPKYKCKVGRDNFFPPPNVDGAIASFRIKSSQEYPHVLSLKRFFSLVDSAFTEKRKMLRKSLQQSYSLSNIVEALATVGLPETSRPEELSLDQFVAFFNSLQSLEQSKEGH